MASLIYSDSLLDVLRQPSSCTSTPWRYSKEAVGAHQEGRRGLTEKYTIYTVMSLNDDFTAKKVNK